MSDKRSISQRKSPRRSPKRVRQTSPKSRPSRNSALRKSPKKTREASSEKLEKLSKYLTNFPLYPPQNLVWTDGRERVNVQLVMKIRGKPKGFEWMSGGGAQGLTLKQLRGANPFLRLASNASFLEEKGHLPGFYRTGAPAVRVEVQLSTGQILSSTERSNRKLWEGLIRANSKPKDFAAMRDYIAALGEQALEEIKKTKEFDKARMVSLTILLPSNAKVSKGRFYELEMNCQGHSCV